MRAPRSLPLLVAAGIVLAGCTAPTTVEETPVVLSMNDVLITPDSADLIEGADPQEIDEPATSSLAEYLERRAGALPPIEPAPCAQIPVDLVLIDRDRESAGTVSTPPQLLVDGALVQQTGREFASAEDAADFLAEYRAAITDCPTFTVQGAGFETVVEQSVADADIDGLDGFVVELAIENPGTSSQNTQVVLVRGTFAVMVSSSTAESDEQRRAGVDAVVDVVGERLRAVPE